MAVGYLPTGQGSSQPQQQAAQAQQARATSAGVAQSIRAMDASLMAKKNEARRIYERSQNMMREDLNTVAGFDVSKAGADAAPALRDAADELRQQIREANDPVEAQRLIGDFRQTYNMLVTREGQRVEDSAQLNEMSTAGANTMADLNLALPPGMEYNEVDAGTVARADQAFRKEFVYQDGKVMVRDPKTGALVDAANAAFISDTSVYQPTQRKADVGDLQTTAQDEAVQQRILARSKGGVFEEDQARVEYDTLTRNSNRIGQILRMQIAEDYLDSSGKSTFFSEPLQAKAFEIGPNENAFARIQGNPEMVQAWKDVWGEPGQERSQAEDGTIVAEGSGWDLLNAEREKFVDYARTAMDSSEILRRQQIAKNRKLLEDVQAPTRFTPGGLFVNTPERQQNAVDLGLDPQDAEGYSMVAIVDPETGDADPIKFAGSDIGTTGEYEIQGFGVDPFAEGGPQEMARITISEKKTVFDGPNGRISEEEYNQLDEFEKPQYTEKTVQETEQRNIPIGPNVGGEGRAIYERIYRDPAVRAAIQEEYQKANVKSANQALRDEQRKEERAQAEAEQRRQDEEAREQQEFEEFERAQEKINQELNEGRKKRLQERLDRAAKRAAEEGEIKAARLELLRSLEKADAIQLGYSSEQWEAANAR
mgnify:CR=1 FL=1